MNAPTIWPGTPEERAERRAQLIGRTSWEDLNENQRTQSVEALRDFTPKRDRWIWAPRHLNDGSEVVEKARGQHYGRWFLNQWEQGNKLELWPRFVPKAEAFEHYAEAWLWDPECLEHDGWRKATVRADDGKMFDAWTKVPGPVTNEVTNTASA